MNNNDPKYSHFALVREMLQTPDVIRKFDTGKINFFSDKGLRPRILLSGEGSSRIFPAKKIIADSLRLGFKDILETEAATQALEYDLHDMSVFVASNSGKTKEGVRLIRHLRGKNHASIIGVVASDDSPIQKESDAAYLLSCGKEEAVAATKSVVEQALFYDILFRTRNTALLPDLSRLADCFAQALESRIPEEVVGPLVNAAMLYWAGRNDGVAEELTLKTNEITRKKSDFLEGTYAAHGIEEVMNKDDALVVVDPFPGEEEKLQEVLVKGIGLPLVAIAHRPSLFPAFMIPSYEGFDPYIQLAAGWNLMVEIGVRLGADLDKPVRARKIGNEFKL